MIATLDVVSGGRLIVGVGTGWLKGEFRVLGVPLAERGPMTDEYLRAMKVLWTEENPEFQGRYVSFSRLAFQPKCVQRPHVPLWIGGTGDRPFRRVIELGDGWAPMTGTLEEVSGHVAHLKEAAAAAGRDPESLDFTLEVLIGEPDEAQAAARTHVPGAKPPAKRAAPTNTEIVDRIAECRRAGLNHFSVRFAWRTPAEYVERLEWFAAEVMSALRS
jgi:probable F420-dependent oxidoreductase